MATISIGESKWRVLRRAVGPTGQSRKRQSYAALRGWVRQDPEFFEHLVAMGLLDGSFETGFAPTARGVEVAHLGEVTPDEMARRVASKDAPARARAAMRKAKA